MTKRRSMHEARKRRIWEREAGLCGECRQPVDMLGPGVRYDHRGTLYLTESDDDEGIFPIHLACDQKKTPGDLKRIAKTKRQSTLRLDVPREPSGNFRGGRKLPGKGQGPKMKGRGFSQTSRPLQSRNDLKRR